jgi:hypothetical protein
VTAALAGCASVTRSPLGDQFRSAPDRRVDPGWRPGPGTWAQDGYGPANTGANPHANPPRAAPAVRWERRLPEPLDDLRVAEGTVYCATRTRLVALGAASGAVRWERAADASGLKYIDGRLYFRTTEEAFAAWSTDGTELWRTELDAEALKDYYEQDGYIYVGTFSGHRVLHADSGTVVRSRDAEWEFLASRPGRLYTTRGGAPGTPITYDVADAGVEERWRVDTDCGVGRPAVGSEQVYYGLDPDFTADCDGSHRLKAVDTTGEPQWTVTFDADLWYPAVAGDRVFVPMAADDGEAGGLACLGTDGERRWTHRASGGLKRAAVADGTVYAVPTRGSTAPLVACDASSGDRLWERAVDPDAALAAAGDTLYVGTGDGLVALA